MTQTFTDQNFQEEVINASQQKPVLVDFYASWCGPCMMQGPIIDEVASELGDKASVGKLSTESSRQTAIQYGVMSIPTLLLFKNGQVVEKFVGVQSKEALVHVLNSHL